MSSACLCRRRVISWKTIATTTVGVDILQLVKCFCAKLIYLEHCSICTAIKMHEKNLEMKMLREDMEKKMRDQLVSFCFKRIPTV